MYEVTLQVDQATTIFYTISKCINHCINKQIGSNSVAHESKLVNIVLIMDTVIKLGVGDWISISGINTRRALTKSAG